MAMLRLNLKGIWQVDGMGRALSDGGSIHHIKSHKDVKSTWRAEAQSLLGKVLEDVARKDCGTRVNLHQVDDEKVLKGCKWGSGLTRFAF